MVRRADALLREKAPALWIRGEISGWRKAASGYCYFTLKDSQAELCCVLPPHAARALPALPENGMEMDAFGQLGVYPKRGQFQLEVARIESTGAGGLWELAGAAEALEARSPLRVLARGYSVVSDRTTGRVVRSPAEVTPQQRLRVRLAEGEIAVRVEQPSGDAPPSLPASS